MLREEIEGLCFYESDLVVGIHNLYVYGYPPAFVACQLMFIEKEVWTDSSTVE
jgi:hypothetical protein